MDPLIEVLSQLGLGIATNAIYDVLKAAILNRKNVAATEKLLDNELSAHGINVQASTIIKVMAE
jgi:hypothetical protein